MEIQRQSEQWGFHREAGVARQAVSSEGVSDLLSGKAIMAGLHQTAAEFNVPQQRPLSDGILEKIVKGPQQGAGAGENEMLKKHMTPGGGYEPITGGPNTWARDQKGAPQGDRGLADLAWAASAPGFDLETDAADRGQAARDYAEKSLANEPWTRGEQRYFEGPSFEEDAAAFIPEGLSDRWDDRTPWNI